MLLHYCLLVIFLFRISLFRYSFVTLIQNSLAKIQLITIALCTLILTLMLFREYFEKKYDRSNLRSTRHSQYLINVKKQILDKKMFNKYTINEY